MESCKQIDYKTTISRLKQVVNQEFITFSMMNGVNKIEVKEAVSSIQKCLDYLDSLGNSTDFKCDKEILPYFFAIIEHCRSYYKMANTLGVDSVAKIAMLDECMRMLEFRERQFEIDFNRVFTQVEIEDTQNPNSDHKYKSWEEYLALKQHIVGIFDNAIKGLEDKDYDACFDMCGKVAGVDILNFSYLGNFWSSDSFIYCARSSYSFIYCARSLKDILPQVKSEYGENCFSHNKNIEVFEFEFENCDDMALYAIAVLKKLRNFILRDEVEEAIAFCHNRDTLPLFKDKRDKEEFFSLIEHLEEAK